MKSNNLKTFENFINESNVNESSSFRAELDSNFYNMNILNLLMDEGLLADDGRVKDGVSVDDLNSFLEQNAGTKDFFEGDSVEAWVLDTLSELHKFAAKFKDEFVR